MKQTLICIYIFFLTPFLLFSQTKNDIGTFVHKPVDVKSFVGKNFKLEAAVKVESIDSSAQAQIWVRVDKSNKKMGFIDNGMRDPIISKEWKTYSISGKIDNDANSLAFGGIFKRKGIFFFDNFKLSIETSEGKFEEMNIPNSDFEDPDFKINWGFQKKDGITLSASKVDFYSGKQSCVIDASQFIYDNIDTYGNNSKTGKYAQVNGIKLYYETYGKGPVLLLLHGNTSSIELFKQQIPEFSKFYKVIAVDTRGQGKSSEDGKKYTYDLFAEDMNAFLDYLHLEKVNVLGWSDGGNTGLIMAMKYPQKINCLVTMGANIFIDNSVVDKWVFKQLNKELKTLESDTTMQNRKRLINLLLTEPNHNFSELKEITCPVLVIAGEKDIIKSEHTKSIAANITKSTLLIAHKETHYYPSENPNEFNKNVLDFLKTNKLQTNTKL